MKTIQSKSLLTLIIIFFIIGFSTSAKNIIGFNGEYYLDTIPLASISSPHSLLIKNPNFVKFPENLQVHREESKDYIKRYSIRERNYIIHMLNKGKGFFSRTNDIFDKYDVPYELRMLLPLESNFNGNAISKAGAVGYWQFMSQLAKEYGLKINSQVDERKNFIKSTTAAAKFFRDQMEYFDDNLLLSVASYNCGQGRVRQAIKKSNVDNPDFWDIKEFLPAETRRFVMKFVALNVIAVNYDKFINKGLNFEEPHMLQLATNDSLGTNNSVSRNAL